MHMPGIDPNLLIISEGINISDTLEKCWLMLIIEAASDMLEIR